MCKRSVHAVAISFAVMAIAACKPSTPPESPKATLVRTVAAVSGSASPALSASGVIVNKDEAKLSFKVGGVIKRIAVNAGDRVRKGQRLAEVELTEIQAQVVQARELAEQAARDLGRGERLYAEQVIPLEQLQQLRTQASVANSRLAATRFNEDYSSIVAPQDGTILKKLAEERELAAAGQPILIFGGHQQGFVFRAGLADRDIVRVHAKDPATIEFDAFPGQHFKGMVSEIGRATDTGSGLFPIEISLEPSASKLVSGLVAHALIETPTPAQSSLVHIPIGAILEGDKDRASVFVVEQEIARRRAVRIAFIQNDFVALTDGVRVGEQVVTDGALYVDDGERVSVLAPDAPAIVAEKAQ
jgi:RND family efflux transporter MFP subunit